MTMVLQRDPNNEKRLGEFDSKQSVPIIISEPHHEIHEGDAYLVCDVQDVANGATFDYLIATPNTTTETHFIFIVQSEAEASFQFFENPTVSTVGTAMVEYNRERNSSNVAGVIVTHTPTVSTTGTVALCNEHWGSGKAAGGEGRGTQEWVLKTNEQYLIRLTNETTSNNQINSLINWYEHTPE